MIDGGKPLDIDTVQAFVLIADLASFTRAAQALDTSQAAISLKLKRLEERLGYRLLERTPRHVRLTPCGEQFIQAARNLLQAHARALGDMTAAPTRRLVIGISDHVAGPDLPVLLSRLAQYDPLLLIEVRIASSRDLSASFDDAGIAWTEVFVARQSVPDWALPHWQNGWHRLARSKSANNWDCHRCR